MKNVTHTTADQREATHFEKNPDSTAGGNAAMQADQRETNQFNTTDQREARQFNSTAHAGEVYGTTPTTTDSTSRPIPTVEQFMLQQLWQRVEEMQADINFLKRSYMYIHQPDGPYHHNSLQPTPQPTHHHSLPPTPQPTSHHSLQPTPQPTSQPTRTDLPPELDTPEGRRLLSAAQAAGWLDDHYRPLNLKKVQMALLAGHLGDKLNLPNKWVVFERFWGERRLDDSYVDGLSSARQQPYFNKLVDTLS